MQTIRPLTRILAREDNSLLTALFQVVNTKSNSFSERRELMDSVACLLEADYKMPHVLNNTLSIEMNQLAKTGASKYGIYTLKTALTCHIQRCQCEEQHYLEIYFIATRT